MNSKTKETILDMAHILHQALITDDDAIAQQALGDVADALASLLPLEVAAPVPSPSSATGAVGAASEDRGSTDARCTFHLARAGAYGIVTLFDTDGVRLLQARIEKHTDTYSTVHVYKAGDNIESCVTILVTGGFDRAKRVAQWAMRGLMSSIGHKRRIKDNRRKRIERELAATVARQMDDDDLAQRLENA